MGPDLEVDAARHIPPISRLCRYTSEGSPQPMVAVEGTTHVVMYLNPAFARLVGRERDDLVGRPFAEAVPEGNANGCLAHLDRVFRTGIPEKLAEQEHLHKSPGPVYWSYEMWAILGEDDQPAGVMIQVTDSTETALFRRQVTAINEVLVVSATRQHELADGAGVLSTRLQAAVRARDHFLAVLSHELRNPLAAMNSGLQLLTLARSDPGLEDSSALMGMMGRQLKRLVWLVDDLLDVSRIATGKLTLRKERMDLRLAVRDAVESVRPLIDLKGHGLTVTLPPDPVLLDADPTRLAQVFLNLLNNAAKYSDTGGQIRLSVRRDGDEVVVIVGDTGIGIPASRLAHIFEPYEQVDTAWERVQGGMGIGLSLVREFVGLHGGRVEACSDGPGRGSEFIVRLPTTAGPAAAEPPTAAAGTPRVSLRRVLVVDDNKDAAETLARWLRRIGHEVHTALGGADGVAEVAAFRPEVILMDLGMPTMDGFEAARRIRAGVGGDKPLLVALSGWGADDDRRRTHDAGFDRHLIKPLDPDDLATLFAEMPIDSP